VIVESSQKGVQLVAVTVDIANDVIALWHCDSAPGG
jgi:hypothetical protein